MSTNWEKEIKLEDRTMGFFIKGMKVLWELIGKQKKNILIVFIWMVFIEALNLALPFFLKLIFDEIPQIMQTGEISDYFIYLVVAMLLVNWGEIYLDRFSLESRFLIVLIELENKWPKLAHKKLLNLSLGYHSRENTGKKIAKIDKGCGRMVDIMCHLRWGLMPQLIYLVLNVVIVFILDWRLGLLFLIPFIPASYINMKGLRKTIPVWEEFDRKKEEAGGVFCQSIINIETVQNYVQEVKEKKSFSSIRREMKEMDIDTSLEIQKYLFAMNIILKTFFVLTIVYGIHLLLDDNSGMTIGTIVFVIATGNVTFKSLWHIVNEYMEISKKIISVLRMKELLDEDIDIQNKENAIVPDEFKGVIKAKDVVYSYPGKKKAVLDGVDIDILPGKMIAFIGRSGEGKSTAVKLLCRVMDIDSGSISLDGVDIRDLDVFWYRKHFAIVQQDIDIFDASILENIRYAYPEAGEKQVEEALRASYLHVVLEDKDRFPKGIHEQIGERGVKLSGGERQRVGIARAYLALLKGARVLILDEATSSLDSESERAIQTMINKLRKNSNISIVAIAHRLSTIQKSDEIYVINGGKVVEKANHDELMQNKGLYSELVKLQKIRD